MQRGRSCFTADFIVFAFHIVNILITSASCTFVHVSCRFVQFLIGCECLLLIYTRRGGPRYCSCHLRSSYGLHVGISSCENNQQDALYRLIYYSKSALHVSGDVFQYISNKMQSHTVYLYLDTALHVSGGTSTHHQERI
jgi:hypothetical protein